MRIISGSARGLKLQAPAGLLVRPTADRIKESLFNILGSRVWEAKVLDLFAGTGNLGLEALSRGAKQAVFIEHSQVNIQIINANTIRAKLTGRAQIRKVDVLLALNDLRKNDSRFDLIFCDPPYNKNLATKVLNTIDECPLLTPDGIIIIEHSQRETLPVDDLHNLEHKRTRKYGDTLLSFFTKVNGRNEVEECCLPR